MTLKVRTAVQPSVQLYQIYKASIIHTECRIPFKNPLGIILELELLQSHMTQTPMLRGEVNAEFL